jgi:hypothetical protein
MMGKISFYIYLIFTSMCLDGLDANSTGQKLTVIHGDLIWTRQLKLFSLT